MTTNYSTIVTFVLPGTGIYNLEKTNIGGVMVNVLASSMVDLGQTKEYKFDMCCFSAKHAASRRKSKDWLARNQNNVSEWSDMSYHALLFQSVSTKQIQLSVLIYYKADLIIFSLKIYLYST